MATLLIVAFVAATYAATDAFTRQGLDPGLVPVLAVASLVGAGALVHARRMGWAFVLTSVSLALATGTIFLSLYPRVMVSSLNPDWSLTIYNASSSPHTLRIMSVIALVIVPVVLVYQGWTYWVFRHRVGGDTKLEY